MSLIFILFTFFHFFMLATIVLSSTNNHCKTYVTHIDPSSKPTPFPTHESWHLSIIDSLSEASSEKDAATHLYSYNHVMSGFSASISSSHLDVLKQMPGYIAAFPETYGTLHTTHTPRYLGLSRNSGLWPVSNYGDGVIIGVIDTGIWPESKSFLDMGMAAVPSRWKGKCEEGVEFTSDLCNRKLIGARSFSKGIRKQGYNISTANDYDSPRDFFGHGTHTSSTAAGSPVSDVSYFGYAEGTMTGIAPKAHVAMYKALFYDADNGAAASDVLAAMDQAIEDGVDVMSISLGFYKTPFYEDIIALGAFAAMEKGIFVSVSAGNSGPHAYTVINSAPWLTSVGAGTIDRDYTATVLVHLEDGASQIRVDGRSIFPENLFVSNASFYFGAGNSSKETCSYLDPSEVEGKFVFCSAGNDSVYSQISEIENSGAEGAIFATNQGLFLSPKYFNRPYVTIGVQDSALVEAYLRKAIGTLTVDIKFIQTKLGSKPAPQVVYFSSRGPSLITPGILKPDILAPGVNVLSSWVPNRGFVAIGDDYILSDYVLASGTSMAAPHIAGIAALLKSVHPEWSMAAIRSAMMTTADIVDNAGGTIIDMTIGSAGTPLDFGAGHVNPNKAIDPGLVYDIGYEDYLNFICGLNYTRAQRAIITRTPDYNCTRINLDLNYPSFMVVIYTNVSSQVFTRVLTSVVDYNSSYSVTVYEPNGMNVTVQPSRLHFEGKGSKAEYSIKVDVDLGSEVVIDTEPDDYIGNFGFISWNEIGGKHKVRSPIVSAFAP